MGSHSPRIRANVGYHELLVRWVVQTPQKGIRCIHISKLGSHNAMNLLTFGFLIKNFKELTHSPTKGLSFGCTEEYERWMMSKTISIWSLLNIMK